MVSVLDGEHTFRISWDEMQDSSKWVSGWLHLSNQKNKIENRSFSFNHPSDDSGLNIPIRSDEIRPWFEN